MPMTPFGMMPSSSPSPTKSKEELAAEFKKPPTVVLISEMADEVMTAYQIAHALKELASLVTSSREDLRSVYLNAAQSIAETFALELMHNERQRIRAASIVALGEEEKLKYAGQLKRTVRERGRIVHYVRGSRKTVTHGYVHGDCIWCKIEEDDSKVVEQADEVLEDMEPLR